MALSCFCYCHCCTAFAPHFSCCRHSESLRKSLEGYGQQIELRVKPNTLLMSVCQSSEIVCRLLRLCPMSTSMSMSNCESKTDSECEYEYESQFESNSTWMSARCLAKWQVVIVTIYGIRTADERGRVAPSGGFLFLLIFLYHWSCCCYCFCGCWCCCSVFSICCCWFATRP